VKQKAEIIFEQEETVILRQSSGHFIDFCPNCIETVELLTPEIMAAIAGTTEREIFRLIERGTIYFLERERIFGCPNCYKNSVVEISRQTATEK